MNKIFQTAVLLSLCSVAHSNTLYVDNVSDCAGNTSCYSTIQQALNNAIADDEIRVFPGTYAKTIDLSLMGSALGLAENGNIRFITVDPNNNITPRTVQVTPVNGTAFTHTDSFFEGNIVLDGFVVVSMDDDGIDFDLVVGNITVRNMTASGNNKDGIDLQVAIGGYTMSVYDTIVENNGEDGLNLDGPDGTRSFIQNVQANNNISQGITITSLNVGNTHEAKILDTSTLNNGNDFNDSAGVRVWFKGDLTVKNLKSSGNRRSGINIIDVTQTIISDSTFENNAVVEGYSGITFNGSGMFLVDRSIFIGNGYSGIKIVGSSLITGVITSVDINCSSFLGNQVGVFFNSSATIAANYRLSQNNFTNQTIAGIHAALDNDTIGASDNWWGDASGPTHIGNAAGTGDKVSDSLDDAIGGAIGTVDYSSFVLAPINIKQYPSDVLFVDGFEGSTCTLL